MATTRWVEYSISAAGTIGTGGGSADGKGTRPYHRATAATDVDSFSIGTGNNRLHIDGYNADGFVTLASGTDLDPRFVARDISEKLHNAGKSSVEWDQAQCVWENGQLVLYGGMLGSSQAFAVVSGTNTVHTTLGFVLSGNTGGTNNSTQGTENSYNGGVTVSGAYNGFFDETYTIVICKEYGVNTPSKGGSNSYTGTITQGGYYNFTDSATYTINIDTTNGTTMGGGTGNVPKMSWTCVGISDDSAADVELLYPNYWYKVGTKGAMVKFTDAVFSHCPPGTPAWTLVCSYPQYTHGTNTTGAAGDALYVWGSTRGDDAGAGGQLATSETSWTRLGSRGIYIKFNGSNNFEAGDEFKVICTPPQPSSYGITNLNYGNVTVSTESAVKAVIFEITSGAVEMSTVKFGLQSHGSFSHHTENNSDTYFRFGTVGPGNNSGSSPADGLEWRTSVTASDISSDTPPSYLYATEDNLNVVSDADDSEAVGASGFMGMTSDPIWLNIKLGASEVGANSTINYRIFFDYS